MMLGLRQKIIDFINSEKDYPIIAGIASGLYPLLYFYNSNYTLLNSWSQLAFFCLLYLIVPIIVFYSIKIVKNNTKNWPLKNYIIPILGFVIFALLIMFSTYGLGRKKLVLLVIIATFCVGIILKKHYHKLIVFQFLLAIITAPKLIPDISKQLFYSYDWLVQEDDIANVSFKKQPNIYLIQPDGYVNFSELSKGYYKFDNSTFEGYMNTFGFKNYPNFRSNYYSTLSSNTSMFGMKHHYYNDPKPNEGELFNSREIIVGKNPVLTILKNNGYQNNLILEHPYLLVNRPNLFYDSCNIDYSDVSFFARGFEFKRDVLQDLKQAINANSNKSNFYFVEKISPGHITSYGDKSDGVDLERNNYLTRLKEANKFLEDVVSLITKEDPDALIIIAADHGGYVGFNYTVESKTKVKDPYLIKSIFSANLSIKWPEKMDSYYENELKTNVNLFRVIFSYLSTNRTLLNHMEDDKSYIQILDGAPFGVYEYLDENGLPVFNKIEEH